MEETVKSPHLLRFASFEVNLRSGELRNNGERVKLPEQSFQILVMLLERPGDVVMRGEIQKRLWPNDTIVEFENSINAAIKKLRVALGDSADEPHYIETLARRGYRWMTSVERVEESSDDIHAPASVLSPRTEAPAFYLIGKRVSHYRVLEVVGGGGMGVVYKAEDIKLGRRVALKFLPEELADDAAAMQRFEREARAASALNHPNICTIYAVEEHKGQPFIAMELLEGRTLRDIICEADSATASGQESPLQLKALLDTAIQIADGLEAAHKKGVIHRDIKPANIFVTHHGQAKILDFGLAKLHEFDAPEILPHGLAGSESTTEWNPLLTLTRTGVTIGTAAYMSPEQVRGEKLDARTDLFSFGLVLYEMATRKRAFAGETAPVLHQAILNQIPAGVRDLNPQISPKLESIINRAIQKDRAGRYQSAAELRADLEELRRQAQPTKTSALRWWVAAAILAALAGLVSLFVYRAWSPLSQAAAGIIRSLAVLPLENLSGDPEQKFFAEGVTEELISRLNRMSSIRVISRRSIIQYEDTRKSIPEIARELGVEGIVDGSVIRLGDRVRIRMQLFYAPRDQQLWAATYERGLKDIQELQADAARDISGEIKLELTRQEQTQLSSARVLNPEAHEMYLKGLYFWNKHDPVSLNRAIEYYQRAIAKDSSYAEAYAGLANSYLLILGDDDSWNPGLMLTKAKAAAEQALRLDPTLADAHTSLALISSHLEWKFDQAREHYQRALELNPNYSTAHHWYGDAYLAPLGQFDRAFAEMHKAQELDPLSPIIGTDIGKNLVFARRYAEAIAELKKALDLDPSFDEAHHWLWYAYMEKGTYREALAELDKAKRYRGARQSKADRALLEARLGNRKIAYQLVKELVSQARAHPYPSQIAFIYMALGDSDQAFAWLERAYNARSIDLIALRVDPLFDPVRSNPRFDDLVRRVGLPE